LHYTIYSSLHHPHLHSFPTRRSSDLSIPCHSILFHSIPLHSTPFHSTPFHSTPLHSTPFHSTPFHSIAFHSIPLHSTPPHSIPSDRKSTRLNSSHDQISYAVFCLKKK